ncbi:MAG: hypothetical protein DMF49_13460 [Acidobacteria bacterium]|nr:MAG: hypothetical protein DMF49_13460 [Acidobacteriota bacterium]
MSLAFLLGALGPSCSRNASNVILITLDTTRADRFGCYGNPAPTTPNFDQLAREGARFDLAVSAAAVTPVSHASILTGLYPYQHGLRVLYAGSSFRLPDTVPTLATVLHEAGWHTAAFLSSFTVSDYFGFKRGFEVFDAGLRGPTDQVMTPAGDGTWKWDVTTNQRRSDETTGRALDWVGRGRRPFFLWIHYWDPHDDVLVPPAEFISRFDNGDGTEDQRKIKLYDAEIAFVDSQFGRLIDSLKRSGDYDKTVFAVVADHGEGLGDHGWWHHRILYQEQIRLPLILRAPGWPKGKAVGELVRSIDIFPTILDAVGVASPPRVEGRSLRDLIEGKPEPPRTAYADALNLFDLNAKMLEKRPNDDLLFCTHPPRRRACCPTSGRAEDWWNGLSVRDRTKRRSSG